MKEVDPKETTRAYAFEMWMKAPMPMVTVFKRLNVTRLAKISKNRGLKFNMLMCWCIGKAAQRIKEFYLQNWLLSISVSFLLHKGSKSFIYCPSTEN